MLVDVHSRRVTARIIVPGRTRWAVFDARSNAFYVNIADPPQIIVIELAQRDRIARTLPVPAVGPHGLDIDSAARRLFCACDSGKLLSLDAESGEVLQEIELTGAPDVIFFNPNLNQLYVAIGDPGVIDVIDLRRGDRQETVLTERGAHTLAWDVTQNKLYAFLPETHRACVYRTT